MATVAVPPPASLDTAVPDRELLPVIRRAVRDVLTACPAFLSLDPGRQRELAQSMVQVSQTAASLIQEELDATHAPAREVSLTSRSAGLTPLAQAQEDPGVGATARNVAATTQAILNAVSFPRFVTDLITGVFRAMTDSSQQQMQAYVDLLNSVAASTEGFSDSQMAPARARSWLLEHYPDAFEIDPIADEDEVADMSPDERTELEAERRNAKLRARPGGQMPSEEGLRADLGLGPNESVPTGGDPERTLVPFVRARLARNRQGMLATMVRMGMQRIVIESGRISASMRFHIDTRDALARDEGSRFALDNEIKAAGSFGWGPWGVSASVKNNISYVSTQRTQTTQEMNTDLDLNSSVEINFKSDYVPLNQLATRGQADAIRANSRNPDAERDAAAEAAREQAQRTAESKRSDSLTSLLRDDRPPAPAAKEGEPGTVGAARRAQSDAEKKQEQRPQGDEEQRPEYQRRVDAQKPPADQGAAKKSPSQKQPPKK